MWMVIKDGVREDFSNPSSAYGYADENSRIREWLGGSEWEEWTYDELGELINELFPS